MVNLEFPGDGDGAPNHGVATRAAASRAAASHGAASHGTAGSVVYLDHAATTPMLPQALAAMAEELAQTGNPSSLHNAGRRARRVIEESREQIAQAFGARPSEVVFTSGGTEADNLAVKGFYWARQTGSRPRPRVLATAIEHHAVLDCVQWLGEHQGAQVEWLPVDGSGLLGPGVLLLARGDDPVPVLHGGGQERDVRSGTLDTAAIRAFAVAVEDAVARRDERAARLGQLRDELVGWVRAAVPGAVLNGPAPGELRLPGNAHFSFPGCEGDALLMLLDARGVACSTGSACTAGVAQPSHVLLAMGADRARARGSLRFTLGWTSTQADVAALGAVIGEVVERARRAGRQGAGTAEGQVAGQPTDVQVAGQLADGVAGQRAEGQASVQVAGRAVAS